MLRPWVACGLHLSLVLVGLACGCTEPAAQQRAQQDSGAGCAGVDSGAGATDAAADDAGASDSGRPAEGVEPALLAGEAINVRDLGGTPLEQGGAVARGLLYRGAPLSDLTRSGCCDMARLGIRTVIDLRTAAERDSRPNPPCVTDLADIVLAPLPVPYSVSPADYIADLNATESIARAFAALGDESAYPVYFHCTWGRDRTGVFAAVVLLALGSSRQDILEEYLLSLGSVGAYPNSLTAVLDEVERRGGIDAYLAEAGIPAAAVAVLRRKAAALAQ